MRKRDLLLAAALALTCVAAMARLLARPAMIAENIGDIYTYHYPFRHLAAASLQAGRLPLWNAYIFAGMPFQASPQSVLFYPRSLLHYFFPLSFAFTLDITGNFILAALGAFLLLRRCAVPRAGAAALAASYALSPYLAYRVEQGVPTLLASLAWAPWVWLAAQAGNPPLFGLTLALQLLSGHQQFAIVNLISLGLWCAWRSPKRLPWLAAGVVCAALLALVQLAPTAEFAARSVRAVWNPRYAVGYSMRLGHFATLAYPLFFGSPFGKSFALLPSEYFELLTLYIGLLPLALAAAGARRAGPAVALAAAGVFLALGGNNPAYASLKGLGLDFLRIPARFAFMTLLGVWFCAAQGWKDMLKPRPRLARLVLAACVLDVLAWSAPLLRPQDPAPFVAAVPAVEEALAGAPRIATGPDVVSPNKSMLIRVPNATGYEAFYLASIAQYTSASERQASADGSRTYIRDWTTPAMSKLAVSRYVTGERRPGNRSETRIAAAWIYENPNALSLVQGAFRGGCPLPERCLALAGAPLDARAAAPRGFDGILFSQADYPGWSAWVNGRPAQKRVESDFFPVVRVARGDPGAASGLSRVYFLFRPMSFFAGLWVSLAMLAWLAFIGMRTLVER